MVEMRISTCTVLEKYVSTEISVGLASHGEQISDLFQSGLPVPGTLIRRGLTRSGCLSGFPEHTNHSLTVGQALAPPE